MKGKAHIKKIKIKTLGLRKKERETPDRTLSLFSFKNFLKKL